MTDRIIEWAQELQSLAQAGLFYGKDVFDRERYQRIRDISAEMVAMKTGVALDVVKDFFCNGTGYQTPKIDTRAVIVQGGKILLVKEADGRWSLPGGWCEYNLSPVENVVKEAKEEAGCDVRVKSVVAVQTRSKHNVPAYPYEVVKLFYLCESLGGDFVANSETSERRFFSEIDLPPLAEEKNTKEQVLLCFKACSSCDWATQFD